MCFSRHNINREQSQGVVMPPNTRASAGRRAVRNNAVPEKAEIFVLCYALPLRIEESTKLQLLGDSNLAFPVSRASIPVHYPYTSDPNPLLIALRTQAGLRLLSSFNKPRPARSCLPHSKNSRPSSPRSSRSSLSTPNSMAHHQTPSNGSKTYASPPPPPLTSHPFPTLSDSPTPGPPPIDKSRSPSTTIPWAANATAACPSSTQLPSSSPAPSLLPNTTPPPPSAG